MDLVKGDIGNNVLVTVFESVFDLWFLNPPIQTPDTKGWLYRLNSLLEGPCHLVGDNPHLP